MVPISRREEVTTTRDCSKNRLSHLWEKLWIGFYVVPTFESPPHSDLGKTLKKNRTTVSRRKWTKRVAGFAVGEQNNRVKGAKKQYKVTFVQTLN